MNLVCLDELDPDCLSQGRTNRGLFPLAMQQGKDPAGACSRDAEAIYQFVVLYQGQVASLTNSWGACEVCPCLLTKLAWQMGSSFEA